MVSFNFNSSGWKTRSSYWLTVQELRAVERQIRQEARQARQKSIRRLARVRWLHVLVCLWCVGVTVVAAWHGTYIWWLQAWNWLLAASQVWLLRCTQRRLGELLYEELQEPAE